MLHCVRVMPRCWSRSSPRNRSAELGAAAGTSAAWDVIEADALRPWMPRNPGPDILDSPNPHLLDVDGRLAAQGQVDGVAGARRDAPAARQLAQQLRWGRRLCRPHQHAAHHAGMSATPVTLQALGLRAVLDLACCWLRGMLPSGWDRLSLAYACCRDRPGGCSPASLAAVLRSHRALAPPGPGAASERAEHAGMRPA